jgi:Tol biopolymer transport system component
VGAAPEPAYALYVADYDGSARRRVLEDATDEHVLAFLGGRPRHPQLLLHDGLANRFFLLNVDTGAIDSLAASAYGIGPPVWSPDGTRIAWGMLDPTTQNPTIGITSAGGGDPTPLKSVTGTERCHSPRWSPSSQVVLFSCENSSAALFARVWRVNADGTGLAALTPPQGTARAFSADWSPDGARIAFVCLPLGLCSSDPDGGNGTVMLVTPLNGLRWRPGERIAYWETSGTLDGLPGLWTAKPDGTGATRLTTNHGEPGMAWSPDGALLLARRGDSVSVGTPTGTAWWGISPRNTPEVFLAGYAWVER